MREGRRVPGLGSGARRPFIAARTMRACPATPVLPFNPRPPESGWTTADDVIDAHLATVGFQGEARVERAS